MEGANTGMEWISTGMTAVTDIFEGVLGVITANPLMTALFVAGTIIPVGLKIIKKFKHS